VVASPLGFLGAELDRIRAAGRHRTLRRFEGPAEPATTMDGREVLQFSSNNYLGLAMHPDVVAAAQEAAATWGTGAGGSRLLSGGMALHRDLEAALAELKGTEDAVVYASGYQANLGAVQALVGREDRIASDALNHASLVDACRLSRASVGVYPHADAQAAAQALAGPARRRMLLTDGVFSMDGDEAPLADLARVAGEAGAILMVDDAHGTGVLGGGAGTAAAHGVADRIDVHMGTLSKALASQGGFIAGSAQLCDYLRNVSRPFIFSTAPSPPAMAAALEAIQVMRREPDRARRLLENAERLRRGLQGLGFRVPAGRTPIVPVMVGGEGDAMAAMRAIEAHGIYVGAVRPPTVPPGSCRLRATVMATHTPAHVDRCIDAFRAAAETLPALAPLEA
jgi:8-amino-7-oxononanoate synthase